MGYHPTCVYHLQVVCVAVASAIVQHLFDHQAVKWAFELVSVALESEPQQARVTLQKHKTGMLPVCYLLIYLVLKIETKLFSHGDVSP